MTGRLERLERSNRRTRALATTATIAVVVTWVAGAAPRRAAPQDVLRARVLVIEDAAGRDRVVLGAPLPDGREYTGMKILSAQGAEQFAVSLKRDGSVAMGFDTRPDVGDPRNTERLNLGVTATGQGWIRYLDNRTRARLWVRLDSADVPWVQFLDWRPDGQGILVRQLGFAGEETRQLQR